MTAPYLPYDCVDCILKYLQNYRSTLFNCLLVNRLWCEATVPLLYSNPFDNIVTYKNHPSIILTLILCFNRAEILQLKNQLKLLNIDNIDINDEYKSLFEYPKYLKIFNYSKISSTIWNWFHSYLYYKNSNAYKSFIPIFYQSILRQCNNINQLVIPLCLICSNYYKRNNIQIFNSSNLIKLNSLRLSCYFLEWKNFIEKNEVAQKFFSNLENICSNLKALEFGSIHQNDSDTKEKLCAIIQKQNNLKVFKVTSCKGLNDIFLSLKFQKHSLVHIEFKSISFNGTSFKNLLDLHNLKYLKFDDCDGVSLDQCKIFEFSSFKLEILIFMDHWSHYDTWSDNIILMIKHLGASLKELRLDNKFLLNSRMIKNISIYCLNLINLEISIKTDDLMFHQYFKNLTTIRNLKIFYDSSLSFHRLCHDDTGIFANLANNLPISVKQVSFCNKFRNYLQFKKFLENCHDNLEIINFTNTDISNQSLNFLLSYIERSNNSLKFLGIKGLKEVFSNDEELKLLNQIKAKGVKIVNFYDDDSLKSLD